MTYTSICEQLKAYIEQRVLDGDDDEVINEDTPLFDWGFMNSLEVARLVAFMNEKFSIDVPAEKMVPAMFKNLHTITHLVIELI
jgi:acyl carrier protein